eukprot:10538118-Lingulodinium_polyedra.AAC.1
MSSVRCSCWSPRKSGRSLRAASPENSPASSGSPTRSIMRQLLETKKGMLDCAGSVGAVTGC